MKKGNMKNSLNQWAESIASRISDEWSGKSSFPEDSELMKDVLTKALSAVPSECKKLIGTGIIEETYFETLDFK
ncbi:hypothetical protein ER57_00885 [Smithella sp. SCADC]|jgi:hypothetical protein|nr:hypothetical protein ER57_11160 [Smithella sp. SCADC]KFO68897.1 hypothetical protein ER57_00885 [Smithella sp. SCADC]